jgi:hypothetical protein
LFAARKIFNRSLRTYTCVTSSNQFHISLIELAHVYHCS